MLTFDEFVGMRKQLIIQFAFLNSIQHRNLSLEVYQRLWVLLVYLPGQKGKQPFHYCSSQIKIAIKEKILNEKISSIFVSEIIKISTLLPPNSTKLFHSELIIDKHFFTCFMYMEFSLVLKEKFSEIDLHYSTLECPYQWFLFYMNGTYLRHP